MSGATAGVGRPGPQGMPGAPGDRGPAGDPGPPGEPGVRRAVAVTGPDGRAELLWPGLTATPVVTLGLEASSGAARSARIVDSGPDRTVVEVRGASVVELLGIQVLGAMVPVAGVTVHGMAAAAVAGEAGT